MNNQENEKKALREVDQTSECTFLLKLWFSSSKPSDNVIEQVGFDPSLVEVRQDGILLVFRSVNRGNNMTILCEHQLKHVITFKFRLKNLVSQTVEVRLFPLPTISSPHSYSNLGLGSSSIDRMFGLLDEVMSMRPLVVSFDGIVIIVRIWCFTLCCT